MQWLTSAVATTLFLALAGSVEALPRRVLFVGNSFFYGAVATAEHYRPDSVEDLNGTQYGGVPAIVKQLMDEAHWEATVALEAVPGVGFDEHYERRRQRLDAAWDVVVMSTYSTLDRDHPGDPAALLHYTPLLAQLFVCRNPEVQLYLNATWTRADQTYLPTGHWYGRPVEAMAQDVRAGYDTALAREPRIRAVIPTGEAWTRAMHDGIADSNPYDGVDAGKLDLWADDHYHASNAGYYLEALVVYGAVTGLDPAAFGPTERAAAELGLAPASAVRLQAVARAQLADQPPAAGRAVPPFGCAPPVRDQE
jgi:hypothetical protein